MQGDVQTPTRHVNKQVSTHAHVRSQLTYMFWILLNTYAYIMRICNTEGILNVYCMNNKYPMQEG